MRRNYFSSVQYHWFFIYHISLFIQILLNVQWHAWILTINFLSYDNKILAFLSWIIWTINYSSQYHKDLIELLFIKLKLNLAELSEITYMRYLFNLFSICLLPSHKLQLPTIQSQLCLWYPWFISLLERKRSVAYFHRHTKTYRNISTSVVQFK